MNTVILNTDKNKRLKQLCKQYGKEWKILINSTPVQCFNNHLGVLVESMDGSCRRWIKYPEEVTIL